MRVNGGMSLRNGMWHILGDPGADSGDEEKSKWAGKYMARRTVKNGEKRLFSPFFTFLRSIYIFPPV